MDIRSRAAFYDPRADDFSLREQPFTGSPELGIPAVTGWCLDLESGSSYYIVLRGHDSDCEAEAAAMDRLAELATKAARLLRARAAES